MVTSSDSPRVACYERPVWSPGRQAAAARQLGLAIGYHGSRVSPVWGDNITQRSDHSEQATCTVGTRISPRPPSRVRTARENENAAGAFDEQGLPKSKVAIVEDVIGANEDQTQG